MSSEDLQKINEQDFFSSAAASEFEPDPPHKSMFGRLLIILVISAIVGDGMVVYQQNVAGLEEEVNHLFCIFKQRIQVIKRVHTFGIERKPRFLMSRLYPISKNITQQMWK